jgi:hypothetical protein
VDDGDANYLSPEFGLHCRDWPCWEERSPLG